MPGGEGRLDLHDGRKGKGKRPPQRMRTEVARRRRRADVLTLSTKVTKVVG